MFIPKKTFEDLREAMQILIDVHKKSVAKLNELDKRVKALEKEEYTTEVYYVKWEDNAKSFLDNMSNLDIENLVNEALKFGRN